MAGTDQPPEQEEPSTWQARLSRHESPNMSGTRQGGKYHLGHLPPVLRNTQRAHQSWRIAGWVLGQQIAWSRSNPCPKPPTCLQWLPKLDHLPWEEQTSHGRSKAPQLPCVRQLDSCTCTTLHPWRNSHIHGCCSLRLNKDRGWVALFAPVERQAQ